MIHFDISGIENQIEKLEIEIHSSGFWDKPEISTVVITKLRKLQSKLEKFKNLENELQNLKELNEFLLLEPDEGMSKQVLKDTKIMGDNINVLELETLFSREIR